METNRKTALVTGAASGMGNHIANVLLDLGYRVMVADINDDALKKNFRGDENCILAHLDISDLNAWENALSILLSKWGQIDYCINIAGVGKPQFFENIDPERIEWQLNVNTKGTFLGTVICGKQMIKQGSGHIINVASLAGVAPIKGVSVYSGSKFAVRGFSLAAAFELRDKGIFLTVICPDLVDTPMMDMLMDHPQESAMTFSGTKKPLSLKDIEKAVLKAFKQKPFEICIPARRGFMAKMGSTFPALAYRLSKSFSKKGQTNMENL